MFLKIHNRRAQSPMEYMGIIALLLAALFLFQRYLVQGFLGRWRGTGETWSYGRQFEPDLTTRCAYYEGRQLTNVEVKIWYDADCFDRNCKRNCFSGIADKAQCLSCMNGCSTAVCQAGRELPPEPPIIVVPPEPPVLPEPPPAPYCGDGWCNGSETCSNCSLDCGMCPPPPPPPPPFCGDGACNGAETCASCEVDCGVCPPPPPPPPFCGDGACNGAETCASCEADCGVCPPRCGDGVCNLDIGEDCWNCSPDCDCLEYCGAWLYVQGGSGVPGTPHYCGGCGVYQFTRGESPPIGYCATQSEASGCNCVENNCWKSYPNGGRVILCDTGWNEIYECWSQPGGHPQCTHTR